MLWCIGPQSLSVSPEGAPQALPGRWRLPVSKLTTQQALGAVSQGNGGRKHPSHILIFYPVKNWHSEITIKSHIIYIHTLFHDNPLWKYFCKLMIDMRRDRILRAGGSLEVALGLYLLGSIHQSKSGLVSFCDRWTVSGLVRQLEVIYCSLSTYYLHVSRG